MAPRITPGELTALIWLNERHLRDRSRQGYFPRVEDHTYPFAEAVAGLFRFYRERGTVREPESSLVPIEDVLALWETMLKVMRGVTERGVKQPRQR